MKRLILFVLLSATFMCMVAEKKDVIIYPPNQSSTDLGSKHPRTPEPSIYAYIEDGVQLC